MPSLRPLLRLQVQIAIWAMLLVVALAPRRSMEVCGGECCAAATAAGQACGCCCGGDVDAEEGPAACHEGHAEGLAGSDATSSGDGTNPDHNHASSCGNCRVSVSLSLELGPLPQLVQHSFAPLASLELASAPEWPANASATGGTWPFDTGPPRPDPKTLLIATTNLRL